jgi:cyclopropane-fatty-acyl-phospholipid synthase
MAAAQLAPPYQDVQAHYDLSNDFYRLFLGPTMLYTCAYYERDDMTLEEAQIAKCDLALGKCDLQPGQRLLDIGCGWGAATIHAVEKYGVRGTGLTLSGEQVKWAEHDARHLDARNLGDRVEFRMQGWEEFDEPVDRIIVLCATEHFREERYGVFFEKCYRLLPPKAPMLIQVIVFPEEAAEREKCLSWTEEDVAFAKFIQKNIFPGGQLRSHSIICRYAEAAGFATTRIQSLQPHYARTLDDWSVRLEANRQAAIELTSPEIYQMYMRYITGCADRYRCGKLDVVQISLEKRD